MRFILFLLTLSAHDIAVQLGATPFEASHRTSLVIFMFVIAAMDFVDFFRGKS